MGSRLRYLALPTLLAVFVHTAVIATESRPREFRSVVPLTALVDGAHRTICTTFSIDEVRQHWMTAAHCLIEGLVVHVEGEPASVVVSDPSVDVAVIMTRKARAQAVQLSKMMPRYGEPVTNPGYPMGIPMVLSGTIASPDAEFPYGPPPARRALFLFAGAKGASGSPILNRRGELVSIFQTTGPIMFDSGVTGGVVWQSLVRFARYFEGGQESGQGVIEMEQFRPPFMKPPSHDQ